jgi:hypothetical protein
MNTKLKVVAMVVVASVFGGISVANAGFNDAPYVTYLNGDEFDTTFPNRDPEDTIESPHTNSVQSATETEKRVVSAKNVADGKERIMITSVVGVRAPLATAAEVGNSSSSLVCAAEEIGYNAPCI